MHSDIDFINTPIVDVVNGIILDSVTGEVTTDENRAIVYYYLKGSEPEVSKSELVIAENKKTIE